MSTGDDSTEKRKAWLLEQVKTSHARLDKALAALGSEQMEAEGALGGWSVKATLAHITWWEGVALHAIRGEPDEDILPGEEWDTDRANAVLFARNHMRPLDDVVAAFRASYDELLRAFEAMPAPQLDEPSPYGDSLARLIAGNTHEHYDEHARAIAATFGTV